MDEQKDALENPPAEQSSKVKTEIYDWLTCIVSAFLFCVLVYVFAVRIIGVDGQSMEPTLHNLDRVIVSNLFYKPTAGDVVVFRKETFGPEPLVKRIIATGGQEVDIDFQAGSVKVDGKVLQEDYINEITRDRSNFVGPVTVPEGCVFVMGDNRNHSTDSRSDSIGFVDERYIMGKVYLIIMPLKNLGRV